MSGSTYPGAPAFPETKVYAYRCTDEKHQGEWTPPMVVGHGGLTKREYFAARIMQGLIASSKCITISSDDGVRQTQTQDPAHYALAAVRYADALIEELNK